LLQKMFILLETVFIQAVKMAFSSSLAFGEGWCPRPELNWDQRFRKPLLYPFELRGRRSRRKYPRRRQWQAQHI
jgi:hypothetical protein